MLNRLRRLPLWPKEGSSWTTSYYWISEFVFRIEFIPGHLPSGGIPSN